MFLFEKSGGFSLNQRTLGPPEKWNARHFFYEWTLLICLLLNYGVSFAENMLFYEDYGDYEDLYHMEIGFQYLKKMHNHLVKTAKRRKTEFNLISKLVPNTNSLTSSHLGVFLKKAVTQF